jgi:16S rRNA (guanine(1405)-N(7))-methyltransferase
MPKLIDNDFVKKVADTVKSSAKYSSIDQNLVEWLIQRESTVTTKEKDLVDRVRRKLHQVAGAYQEKPIRYSEAGRQVENLPVDLTSLEVRDFCSTYLQRHASTHERLPFLTDFYEIVFSRIGLFDSIYDFACGLNPLAISWMNLPKNVKYFGCDIYTDQIDFLNCFLMHEKISGRIENVNLLTRIPDRKVDVAFLLKTIPCLEQLDKSIGQRLLDRIKANTIIISFPAASLSGKNKGMRVNYESHFTELVAGRWVFEKIDFPTEMVFILQK